MDDHPYGWLSLLPPLLAIVLAIATRRVIVSLLTGVILGAIIMAYPSQPASLEQWLEFPVVAATHVGETFLWNNLSDNDHLRVFCFTLLMGAMVAVIQRCGGMHGVVDLLAPLAHSRRGGQLLTWVLGLIVFFDDYANTLLLGGTMRPLCDRLRISREKLAYIVDSTAAPVSGLAIISTWVAGEIGFINEGFAGLELTEKVNGFDIFIETIPYRFYVLLALLFVPLIALLKRDFGPMLKAEQLAVQMGQDGKNESVAAAVDIGVKPDAPRRWLNAAVPVTLMILVTLGLLLATGWRNVQSDESTVPTFINIFSAGNSYVALEYGSLCGLLVAFLLPWQQKIMNSAELRSAAFDGGKQVLPALGILWIAWSLSAVTGKDGLQTGAYVGGLLQQGVAPVWMPTIVFVLASCVSFATGTSWGTMGILMPLVVRVTYQMLGADGSAVLPEDPLMIATIGSVLAGSIFGDHCSPISDTTVLSSQASGCNHVAHVWTQMPYALLVAGVSILCGTLPVGFGVSVWIVLPGAGLLLLACLWFFGTRVDDE